MGDLLAYWQRVASSSESDHGPGATFKPTKEAWACRALGTPISTAKLRLTVAPLPHDSISALAMPPPARPTLPHA